MKVVNLTGTCSTPPSSTRIRQLEDGFKLWHHHSSMRCMQFGWSVGSRRSKDNMYLHILYPGKVLSVNHLHCSPQLCVCLIFLSRCRCRGYQVCLIFLSCCYTFCFFSFRPDHTFGCTYSKLTMQTRLGEMRIELERAHNLNELVSIQLYEQFGHWPINPIRGILN